MFRLVLSWLLSATTYLFWADDVRLYGFVRVNTGDELSRRTKFVLISWVGNNVSAIKRAKMSTDKAVVKSVIQVGFLKCFWATKRVSYDLIIFILLFFFFFEKTKKVKFLVTKHHFVLKHKIFDSCQLCFGLNVLRVMNLKMLNLI